MHIIIARQLRETSSTVSVSFANTTDTPLGPRILEMTESTEDEWSPSVDDRGTKDERLEIKLLAFSQIFADPLDTSEERAKAPGVGAAETSGAAPTTAAEMTKARVRMKNIAK